MEKSGGAPASALSWVGLAAQIERMRPSPRVRRRLRNLRRFYFAICDSADSELANAVLDTARREGFVFWLDATDLPSGPRRNVDAAAAIRAALAVIVFCSHKSVKSNDVFREVAAASQCDKQIVSVALDDVTLPDGHRYYLAGAHMISVSEPRWRVKLVQALEFLDRHNGRRLPPLRQVPTPAAAPQK